MECGAQTVAQWRGNSSGLRAELGTMCGLQGSTFGWKEPAFLGAVEGLVANPGCSGSGHSLSGWRGHGAGGTLSMGEATTPTLQSCSGLYASVGPTRVAEVAVEITCLLWSPVCIPNNRPPPTSPRLVLPTA